MKYIDKRKKAFLLLSSYIIILFTPKIKSHKNSDNVTYNDNYIVNDDFFATYNNEPIYIGRKNFIENMESINPHAIYIIDDRSNKNPNMSICNSYKTLSKNDITAIIKVLIEYENRYPSNWNRTIESMRNEWIIHNICYYLNLETNRTEQVDLDNEDEEKYLHYLTILLEIINNNNEISFAKTKIKSSHITNNN